MVLGEIGNFSAYGFSPASLVAPLGTTTVIGMCLDIFLICYICRAVYNSWQPVYFHTTALYLLLFIRRKVWHLICARGLEFCLRSTAKGQTQDQGCIFPYRGQPRPVKNLFVVLLVCYFLLCHKQQDKNSGFSLCTKARRVLTQDQPLRFKNLRVQPTKILQ